MEREEPSEQPCKEGGGQTPENPVIVSTEAIFNISPITMYASITSMLQGNVTLNVIIVGTGTGTVTSDV